MDLFCNIFSQFHKAITKPENELYTENSKHFEGNGSQKSIEINCPLKINVDLDRKVSKKIFGNNEEITTRNMNKEIVANTDFKNTKFLPEALDAYQSKDNENALSLKFVTTNKSLIITKICGNVRTVLRDNASNVNKHTNKPRQVLLEQNFINNFNSKVNTTPCFDLEIRRNTSHSQSDYTSKEKIDSAIIGNAQNVGVLSDVPNTAHLLATKDPNKHSEMQCMKDQTAKCLEEFDDILAEVRAKEDFKVYDAEALSLDEIDDILYEELEDPDSTYNFQEIKHVDTINLNKEAKIANDSNNMFEVHMMETVITRLRTEIDSKVTAEDNLDVISISSDDTTVDEKKSTHLRVTENEIVETDTKETKPSKHLEVSPKGNNFKEKFAEVTEVKTVKTNESEQSKSSKVRPQIPQNKETDPSNPKAIDDTETVLISSEDEKIDTSDDCGYHSSDFEFISEEEAKLDGFIINFNPERRNFSKQVTENDPYGPGPSRNVARYNKKDNVIADKSYMENFAVPEENEYLNMFQDNIPGLPTCEIHFLEHKSVGARAPMLVQYEGVGFNMNLGMQRVESSDEEYRDEAKESMKKILELYPGENSKRKRRRRH